MNDRDKAGVMGTARVVAVATVTAAAVGALSVLAFGAAGSAPAGSATRAAKARALTAYGKLPLSFQANQGQTDSRVKYLSRGAGYTLFLTPQESVLSLQQPAPHAGRAKAALDASARSTPTRGSSATLRMRLNGANAHPEIVGLTRVGGATNYLNGRDPKAWRTGVPSYARALYRGVYRGVDLLYHGRQGHLEYDFRVAPGADPGRIGLAFSGARHVSLDRQGNLVLDTRAGVVRQHKPVIYQQIDGSRHGIRGRFVLHGHSVGFRVGPYDHSKTLVIDPVLVYSTYLGGAYGETGTGIAVDASGSAYVTGSTAALDFPTTGGFQTTRGGDPANVFATDAFVTKLNPAGNGIGYSTYLGGADSDQGTGIAVDSSGQADVVGNTSSTDFPTKNAFQQTKPADSYQNSFVSVLKPDGSGLKYSTYLGGSIFELAGGIAVDASGDPYVDGATCSTDFPTAAPLPATPLQKTPGGGCDAFAAKLDPGQSGSASLIYSTYLGGTDVDIGTAIAVDGAGSAYLTGGTSSTAFPTKNSLPGQSGPKGDRDGFVTKLNATGSALDYSTYLGGALEDRGLAIAVDSTGAAYVTGATISTDFPTQNAFQPRSGVDPAVPGSSHDAFVSKLSRSGSAFQYSSYLGGKGDDSGYGIAVDASGGAYVVGEADTNQALAPAGSFPTVDPLATEGSPSDPFAARVNPDGSALSFSSYLGGGAPDQALAVALDSSGNAYVTGDVTSTDFPTRGPFQAENAGRGDVDFRDAFVTKLAPSDPAAPLVTGLGRRSGPAGTSLVITGHGFTGASAVHFGAVAATQFGINSDGQLTASAPAQAEGPVPVTVTTGSGTSPPNPIAMFTYAQGTWDETGPLNTPRGHNQSTTLLGDGKVLVAGGNGDGNTLLSNVELYDPATERWTVTTSLNTARQDHTATLLPDGKVLVAGGEDLGNTALASAEIYDPGKGTWTDTRPMATPRADHTATLLPNGKVLVAGGQNSTDGTLNTAALYDPASGTWSTAGTLHDARTEHTATVLNGSLCGGSSPPGYCGMVLVVGGQGAGVPGGFSAPLSSAELYDPSANSWSTTGSLGAARADHTATPLPDGRVLAVGGRDGIFSLRSAEIYDPAAGTFSPTASMQRRRGGAAAVSLGDRKVLVTGGADSGSVHDTGELFDPATAKWGSAGVMTHYRGGFLIGIVSAVPLQSGKVLVLGDSLSAAGSTELWTPTSSAAGGGATGTGSSSSGLTSSGTTGGSDKTAPGVSKFGLTNNPFVVGGRTPTFGSAAKAKKRHRKGTTFRYTLSEAATVRIVIARGRTGRRKGKRCVAPMRKLRKARKCIRLTVQGPLTRTSHKGANRVGFSGRIGSRRLSPGSYQATLTATDAAKNTSRPKTIVFRIVKR